MARFQEPTFRAAYRVLGDREEALDATQEAFLALHARLDSVPSEVTGAWLVRVVTHRALDRVRRRGRVSFDPLAGETETASTPAPAAAAAQAEERQRVVEALARLPERQREVVTLRLLQQETFVDLAAALGISQGAAKVHFRRGLRALRRHLSPLTPHEEPRP